ncbi:AMP-binding protein [Nocardia sp. NPDC058114]|uniref:AMP-binding protein n=1 Tax=Nocardia sp. NPDC058114 TaxID=3346346 RepID=UPI0036DAEAD9
MTVLGRKSSRDGFDGDDSYLMRKRSLVHAIEIERRMNFPQVQADSSHLLLTALHDGTAELNIGGRRLRGIELAEAVGAVAVQVAGAKRVGVATADPLETIVAIAGVLVSGAVAVPLATTLSSTERDHIEQDCEPDLIVDRVDLASRAPLPAHDRADEQPALILYTSGSTGRPKGVVLSRNAIAFDLDQLALAWEWSPADTLSHGLPLSHVHGLVFGALGPLRIGSPLVYTDGLLRPVSHATMYFGVPALWSLLTDTQLRDMRGARLFASGAAPLSATLYQRIADVSGLQVFDRYALTETLVNTAPRVGENRGHALLGSPLPGVDVELRDVGLPDNVGEVVVRGPNLFLGYLGQPAPFDDEGWFTTGDLGKWVDESLRLVGRRATDLIKTAGYRVGAGEVEDALLSHPAVVEAAVLGVRDDALGEKVTAWLVTSTKVTKRALHEHAAHLLSPYKQPLEIHLVSELPRNRLGKIQKAQLLTDEQRPKW